MGKTIEFVGVGTFNSGVGSITVNFPAGIKTNDLLLILVHSANETISTPSGGWAEVGDQTVQAVGTAAAAGGTRLAVFWKWAAASESNVTIADSGNTNAAQSIVFRYVNKTNPFITTANGTQASSANAPTLNGITTTVPGALVLWTMGVGRDSASTNNFSALTNSNLASITERIDQTVIAGQGGGLACWTSFMNTTGSTGDSTTTKAVAWTDSTVHLTIGLRPKARRFAVS